VDVVNESLEIVYTGIMNDKGVRYTLVRHRNERHGQKRACKFDHNIFVAMVEQSRNNVPPERNERFKLSIHCQSFRFSAPCSERDRVRFCLDRHFIFLFCNIHVLSI